MVERFLGRLRKSINIKPRTMIKAKFDCAHFPTSDGNAYSLIILLIKYIVRGEL